MANGDPSGLVAHQTYRLLRISENVKEESTHAKSFRARTISSS